MVTTTDVIQTSQLATVRLFFIGEFVYYYVTYLSYFHSEINRIALFFFFSPLIIAVPIYST